MNANERAEKYLDLITSYTNGEMESSEFMHRYLTEFKEDYHDVPADEPYEVLEPLFFACDRYCPDTDPQKVRGGIGEEQFFKEAAYARRNWRSCWTKWRKAGPPNNGRNER
ncbi:colicin immunity domain-containing protein [Haloarcula argentinensis]|uniref:Colicin immunity domain-containing protein n=1 Tax=Haloarcula argentinensis TaxID=43776 RepID=A0ABU2F590_HALAR|nr:colicin immunity domain-containing protein [Haloarcula argentinensis]MDS0255763.1 colicin immunity domain-containing protein [Haloarcula argentinensis]